MAVQPIPNSATISAPGVQATTGAKPVMPESKKAEAPPSEAALSNEQIEQTVDEIRRRIEPVAQNLLFTIDKDTGKTIVRLIDSTTKEVLRQIPSEELIAIARSLGKSQSGLIERKA
ncbi:flagellar protein FlaG [Methyloversatilis discipulorum]|jgi:flagellar protein FlaG|uniref:flagellar protein FlaG n=1 Tax=Methyloversatilis discipulorum TaxID=1119528 RepID=UPI001E5BF64C|nr:flagellar protein FlaG [Methyloversatilis discipulorum]